LVGPHCQPRKKSLTVTDPPMEERQRPTGSAGGHPCDGGISVSSRLMGHQSDDFQQENPMSRGHGEILHLANAQILCPGLSRAPKEEFLATKSFSKGCP